MKTCDYCTHVEMCGWRKEVKEQGCEFFGDGIVWIPVSERLPENSGCVLVSIAGDIEFGAYDGRHDDWAIWVDSHWFEGIAVDAWMPLPEPYREDGE